MDMPDTTKKLVALESHQPQPDKPLHPDQRKRASHKEYYIMATLLSKTYEIPEILSHRSTCLGEQYTVKTPGFIDVVTVNGPHASCTCQSTHCSHILTVLRTRAQQAREATERALKQMAFDLSYGDIA
jgi:hypothetical protein